MRALKHLISSTAIARLALGLAAAAIAVSTLFVPVASAAPSAPATSVVDVQEFDPSSMPKLPTADVAVYFVACMSASCDSTGTGINRFRITNFGPDTIKLRYYTFWRDVWPNGTVKRHEDIGSYFTLDPGQHVELNVTCTPVGRCGRAGVSLQAIGNDPVMQNDYADNNVPQ